MMLIHLINILVPFESFYDNSLDLRMTHAQEDGVSRNSGGYDVVEIQTGSLNHRRKTSLRKYFHDYTQRFMSTPRWRLDCFDQLM